MAIDSNHPTSRDAAAPDPLAQPSRMLALFNIDAQQNTWTTDELGDILAHQLEVPLREMGIEGASDDVTIRQLLAEVSPAVAMLEKLKQVFKTASLAKDGALPKEVATVLYLATIVAAQRGGHSLTKLDAASLQERIDWALNRRWLDPALRKLFIENLDLPGAGS